MLFLLTLPLINPWVRGDGVGYYAYARAMLIQHNLDFRSDWEHANQSFRMARLLGYDGQVRPHEYTRTGHVNNHFAMGSAILWDAVLDGGPPGRLCTTWPEATSRPMAFRPLI